MKLNEHIKEHIILGIQRLWRKNGTSIYYNGGKVGIGTTNPKKELHVVGVSSEATPATGVTNGIVIDDADYPILNLLSNSSTGVGGIFFGDTDNPQPGRIEYLNSVDGMRFLTNSSIKMFIAGSGQVGIGTTGPSNILHVSSGTIPLRVDASGTKAITATLLTLPVTEPVYGGTGSFLGDPTMWMNINVSGTNYKLPLYT